MLCCGDGAGAAVRTVCKSNRHVSQTDDENPGGDGRAPYSEKNRLAQLTSAVAQSDELGDAAVQRVVHRVRGAAQLGDALE